MHRRCGAGSEAPLGRSDPLSSGGEAWRSPARWSRAAWGKPCLRATVDKTPRRRSFWGYFLLLFNILKCDERINGARLPDPYGRLCLIKTEWILGGPRSPCCTNTDLLLSADIIEPVEIGNMALGSWQIFVGLQFRIITRKCDCVTFPSHAIQFKNSNI